jgi:host factor-I protein
MTVRFGEGRLRWKQKMVAHGTPMIQDTFLKHLRDNGVEVTIFLVNGIRLQGQIRRFDSFTALLGRGSAIQVVYKHAISAINPAEPIQLPNVTEETQERLGSPE